MFGYIYKTTNNINNKIYVGKKHSNVFIETYYGSGKLIKRAINKYGVNNFKVEVIQFYSTLEELNEAEKYWISYFKSNYWFGHGYNISGGGDGGDLILNLPKSDYDKFIEDCRSRSKGKNNPNYGNGHKISGDRNPSKRPEVRKKLSESNKGKNNAMYGKTGDKHPNFGKKYSEEQKNNVSKGVKNQYDNRPFNLRMCSYCNNVYITKSAHTKYCSRKCKSNFHNRKKKK